MRAVVCPEYGPPEVVRVEERAAPTAGPGQVGVRVEAAAVNYPDVLLVAGTYQVKVAPPFVPGSEFAGVIDQIGPGVSDFAVGDRVSGTGMVGAFAQHVVVDPACLALVPGRIDARTAAAFGVAHRTAYHALRSTARLRSGERLVVLGAGGGVGLAAVQLGAALGADVTAVASSNEKLAAAARYGATQLVNHRECDVRAALREKIPGGADVVIDPVGGSLSEPALRSLGRGGRFVTVGFASGEIPRIPLNLVLIKGVHVLGFQFQDVPVDEFGRNETELHELLVAGRAAPHIGAVYRLDEVAAALHHVGDGRAIGKVLIDLR